MRGETMRCMEDSVLLCASYTDYDGVSRGYRDRQSRVTLGSFRAMEGLGKLRMRALHRLGKAVVHRRVEAGEWVIPPEGAACRIDFLTQGSVVGVKVVEVLSYHRQPTSTRQWEWREVRGQKAMKVRTEVGPCVLGGEALMGVKGWDCGWKALTACEVYGLERRDFHLLMGPQAMEGWRERVVRGREELRRTVVGKMEEEERVIAEQVGKRKRRKVKVEVHTPPHDGALTASAEKESLTPRLMRSRSVIVGEDVRISPALYNEVRGILHLSAFLPQPQSSG